MKTSAVLAIGATALSAMAVPYPIVDTGQTRAFGPYAGQDAHYAGNAPAYRDNGDGTISDLVTGLMWTRNPGEKITLAEAMANASKCRIGGHDDWRLPTIKELYSLINFNGVDPDPRGNDTRNLRPFIDNSVFDFKYGDPARGERIIDSQFATSTLYVSTTMGGNRTMFGVNFADGRIKGYPAERRGPRGEKTYHVLYVRGNPDYGQNDFHDNGDGTITDRATGLTWLKADSGQGMDWPSALAYAENMEFAGHSDWRLPNAKELQSLVDYTRSPDTTDSAAIDPVFECTPIQNEGGRKDYGQYWTSTTHIGSRGADTAVYVAFGRALGWMQHPRTGRRVLMDVHGAGAQRSDPKVGDASRFPYGRGPQGDVIRIQNMVRLVRGGNVRRGNAPVATEASWPNRDQPNRGRPSAASSQRRPGPGAFIDRFDRNGDGKVTRREFDGPPRRFEMLDRDRDGIVTREEAAAAPPPPGRGGFAPRPPTGPGREQPPAVHPVPPPERDAALELPKNPPDPGKPNIILILADDLGWTGLSVAMDDRIENSASDFYQTPSIARLADQGMRFSRAYAPAALCTPSRASILTGKTPAQLHITTPGGGGRPEPWHKLIGARQLREFPASETTIAEALKQAGYATAHFGKWHLPRSDPGEHGFDFHDGATANDGSGADEDPNPKDIFGLTDRAIRFIEAQVAAGRPFYLQLSHYAVHTPIRDRAESLARFEKQPPGTRHRDVDFAAMTYDLDAGTGLLLDRLDALGLADTTYVVFMSDNGAPGGPRRPLENAPLRGGKGNFYEGGIRVPLIVRGPGIQPGRICRESVAGWDLLPTFCGWAGITPPKGIEGTDLAPLLQGRAEAFHRSEPALLFHFPHYGQGRQIPQSALILGDYKLLKDWESGICQLFDLSNDIGERHDLAQDISDKHQELARLLDERLAALKAQLPTVNPDYNPASARTTRRR